MPGTKEWERVTPDNPLIFKEWVEDAVWGPGDDEPEPCHISEDEQGDHPADWICHWSCGCTVFYCDEHLEYVRDRIAHADVTCSGHTPVARDAFMRHVERLR